MGISLIWFGHFLRLDIIRDFCGYLVKITDVVLWEYFYEDNLNIHHLEISDFNLSRNLWFLFKQLCCDVINLSVIAQIDPHHLPPPSVSPSFARSQSKTYATATTEASLDATPPATPLSNQQRLERIWSQLYTPEHQRLDFAIKYSGQSNHSKLDTVTCQRPF